MRLSAAGLGNLPAAVARPAFRPAAHDVGVVHLGIGAFHRAHQAVYLDDVLAGEGGDWRVLGVSLRSPAVRDQLAAQDGLYSLAIRDGAGERRRVIGAVAGVRVAPEDPRAVLAALAAPATKLVTLTVTEKGYLRDPATGRLDANHPDVRHDAADPDAPRSAPGFLVEALRRRRAAVLPPLTILSCDNLPDNGRALRTVLVDFARLRDPALGDWLDGALDIPSTMVDRIVPATTAADLDAAEAALAMRDEGAVATEPFTQWVVEDRFAGPMPDLARAGVQLVDDVRPFELAKLRMLNGSHSTLAYLGALARYDHVHQAIAAPALRGVVRRLMLAEAAPTLPAAGGLDPEAYAGALLARFENPALNHRLRQIAIDGSQKLPQRLVGTIRDRLVERRPFPAAALGVAAWIAWIAQERKALDDPLAGPLASAAARAGSDPEALARSILGVRSVFGDVGGAAPVRESVTDQLRLILADGPLAAAEALCQVTA